MATTDIRNVEKALSVLVEMAKKQVKNSLDLFIHIPFYSKLLIDSCFAFLPVFSPQ